MTKASSAESEIRRYHRKCGCISSYTYNPDNFVKTDIFDIQLCELHKSEIIDEYEIWEDK